MAEGASLDVERVEVLKGPQGTLFGQNSTGGAINYIAAKPTDTLKGGFNLTYGRFNEVDADGYVSGPITDGLTFRLAARHEYRDDWQTNNRADDTSGRARLQRGSPARRLEAFESASRSSSTSTAGAIAPTPSRPRLAAICRSRSTPAVDAADPGDLRLRCRTYPYYTGENNRAGRLGSGSATIGATTSSTRSPAEHPL